MAIQNKIISRTMIATMAFVGWVAHADRSSIPSHVPTGRSIGIQAGVCSLGDGQGPLGQTTKAGIYNEYCDDLTESEICLALIKLNMNNTDGTLNPAYSPERASYCMEHFAVELGLTVTSAE